MRQAQAQALEGKNQEAGEAVGTTESVEHIWPHGDDAVNYIFLQPLVLTFLNTVPYMW